MLAAKPKPEELDKVLAALPYPAMYSPKLDGIRATVQHGRLYSRSLKPIPNKELQAMWGRPGLEGLDGEIIVGPAAAADCFARSTSVAMSRDKPAEGAVFHVFDRLLRDTSFHLRLADAENKVALANTASVRLVRHELLKTHAAALKYEEKMVKLGHEGVMRRWPDGLYKQGRSTLKEGGLIAVKRFVDAEAVVLDTYEQEENTNAKELNELGKMKRSSHKAGKTGKGTLGGFTVRPLACACEACLRDRCAFCLRQFNIGTGVGLTDAVRAELWARRKTLVGKIVKFRYQKTGTKDKPRIPIFIGFRDVRDL
jgi:DNA ligase-1